MLWSEIGVVIPAIGTVNGQAALAKNPAGLAHDAEESHRWERLQNAVGEDHVHARVRQSSVGRIVKAPRYSDPSGAQHLLRRLRIAQRRIGGLGPSASGSEARLPRLPADNARAAEHSERHLMIQVPGNVKSAATARTGQPESRWVTPGTKPVPTST